MFEPLPRRESAVDACAASIRRAILTGELVPGTRLPPERRLAETFGVNRVTVRSALARLAEAKLVRARQGSGYLVQDFRDDGGPDLLPGLAALASEQGRLAEVVEDLLLVRRQLARAVLLRLSGGVAEPDRAAVAVAVDAFASVASEPGVTTEQVAAADLAVMAAVLDATGSPVLRLCLNPITAVLARLPRVMDAIYAEPALNARAYRVLLAWLASPDPRALDRVLGEMVRRDADTLARLRGDP